MTELIVVFGATGRQGGSVVDALLAESKWKVRAVTRNVNSPTAKALQQKGVEVVEGSLFNEDQVRNAMKGAYGVFMMTNFWDPEMMGNEEKYGIQAAKIAKEVGVKHYIWSTLPDVHKLSNGRLYVPHFTDKSKVDEAIKKMGFEFYSFIYIGFYFTNFSTFAKVTVDSQGVAVFPAGLDENGYLALYDVEDTGPVVASIFRNREAWNGKYISMIGDLLTMKEIMQVFTKVTGMKARLKTLTPDDFKGNPMSRESIDMWEFKKEMKNNPFGDNAVDSGRGAYPKMKTWEEWLIETKWKPS